jgi:hypothetical protein
VTCQRHTQLLDLLPCTHEHYDLYLQAIVQRCAQLLATPALPDTSAAVLGLVEQLVRTQRRTMTSVWTAFSAHRALLTSGLLRFLHEQRGSTS